MLAHMVSNGNRAQVPNLRGVDPETCMIVFKNHWVQVLRVLEKHDPNRGTLRFGPFPGDETSAVQNYVEHMLFLLTEEEGGVGGAMGPILEFVVVENVMEKLFLWSLHHEFTDDAKLEQLRMYQMLVSCARQPLLHHKPVLRPLMMLLATCSGPTCAVGPSCTVGPACTIGTTCTVGPSYPQTQSSALEVELVQLLWQLCDVLVRDPIVLQLLFHSSQDQGAANFLVFSLLVPFVHREGQVGVQARDALTLIMILSTRNTDVARHIVQDTYFCPVLATGLSGLFSWLPAKLEVCSEGRYCLQQADCMQVPALAHFLTSLQFCSTVCRVAHPSIRNKLLAYIYNGFLVPVLAPALHKITLEEVMTSTAYLELFLRSIVDPALLQIFLIFILKHRHDNVNILDTLVSRINTPFQLGTVSLALFRTLIGLYCEDVMLQLILRYLIPCAHLRCGERLRLRERDCQSSSAAALLSLTPSFFNPKPCPSQSLPPKPDYVLWSKVTEVLLKGNMGLEDPFSGDDNVPCSTNFELLLSCNYLQYLSDARSLISTSIQACQVWSAPYDGLSPSPSEYEREEEFEEQDERRNNRVGCDGKSLPPCAHLNSLPELEKRETLPESELHNSLSELELQDSLPGLEQGDKLPELEQMGTLPEFECKDTLPELEWRDTLPELERMGTLPELERRDTLPMLERRDTLPELEQGDSIPELEWRDTLPELDQRDTLPELGQRDTLPELEWRDTLPELGQSDTLPELERKDTLPELGQRDTLPELEWRDTLPELERRDTLPELERRDTLPELRQRDTLPELEWRGSLPELEWRDTLPELERKDTLPELRQRDTLPELRQRDTLPELEWRGSLPELEWRDTLTELGRRDTLPELERRDTLPELRQRDTLPELEWRGSLPELEWRDTLPELGRRDTLPELEWDDSYDTAPHAEGNQEFTETTPKHVQEMRKHVSMLIQGSHMKESDVQDDILDYNLIDQKDKLDDHRASLKNTNRNQKSNHSHCHSPTKPNNNQLYGNTQNHIYNNEQNYMQNNLKPSSECLFEVGHSEINRESRQCQDVLNEHITEEGEEQTDTKTASFNHSQKEATVTSQEQQPGLGRDDKSTVGNEVHFQRLIALLYGKEEEVDFSSLCSDDYEDDEGSEEQSDWDDSDKRKRSVPFTGPFISVLLSRLENMLENPLEVNLLVTGILAQLASYPQPLLRSFLLTPRPAIHASVRSLYQVLVSVGCQIEQHAVSRPEFAQMVQDVAQSLLRRDQALTHREQDILDDYGCFRNGHDPLSLQTRLPSCPKIPPQSRKRVLAAFLYAEFLKELAAIAQEHSVLPDLPTEE